MCFLIDTILCSVTFHVTFPIVRSCTELQSQFLIAGCYDAVIV